MAFTGNLVFHTADWSETGNMIADINGNMGKGNAVWGQTGEVGGTGNELVYEARVKKSAYDLDHVGTGFGQLWNGGCDYTVHIFAGGQYAYGQHGGCSLSDGTPIYSGASSGHLVPNGWVYIQLRACWADRAVVSAGNTSGRHSPIAFFSATFDDDAAC